jgi:cell division septation protein DedD
MNRRTSPPGKKTSEKRGRFPVQLSRREAFLWLGVASFAMLWMFTLGVIVGRGHSPIRFDIENIRNELTALKEQALKRQAREKAPDAEMAPDEMSFDFYEALTDKKEEARSMSAQKAQEEPPEPMAQPEPAAEAESKALPKTPEKMPQGQQPRPSAPKKETAPTPFAVQVASLQDSTKAMELVSSLKRKGYIAYAVAVQIPGKGTYHRVRVGHFRDRHEAGQVLAKLRQANPELKPMVIRE